VKATDPAVIVCWLTAPASPQSLQPFVLVSVAPAADAFESDVHAKLVAADSAVTPTGVSLVTSQAVIPQALCRT